MLSHGMPAEYREGVSEDTLQWLDAACEGRTVAMIRCVGRHAAEGRQNVLQRTDYFGFTALHWSAYCAHEETLRALIELGADVNAATFRSSGGTGPCPEINWTPLHSAMYAMQTSSAIFHRGKKCVKVLLEMKAAVDAVKGGLTPLHVAVLKGWAEIAKWLVNKGADTDFRAQGDTTHQGLTPLEMARWVGYDENSLIVRIVSPPLVVVVSSEMIPAGNSVTCNVAASGDEIWASKDASNLTLADIRGRILATGRARGGKVALITSTGSLLSPAQVDFGKPAVKAIEELSTSSQQSFVHDSCQQAPIHPLRALFRLICHRCRGALVRRCYFRNNANSAEPHPSIR